MYKSIQVKKLSKYPLQWYKLQPVDMKKMINNVIILLIPLQAPLNTLFTLIKSKVGLPYIGPF
jgi:hypothetical protein